MKIFLKTEDEIELMRQANQLVGRTLGELAKHIKPGKPTADYIDTIMSRITLPGSLFIAFIAIMPALAGLLNVQDAFSQFFGGTSLLILVGVVLDTLQQIESHLLMRHYDGLLNSGRIHGRGGVTAY
jgi:preprotein translocase subunit SecY